MALDLDGQTGWDAYVSAYVADESSPPNERSKRVASSTCVVTQKGGWIACFFCFLSAYFQARSSPSSPKNRFFFSLFGPCSSLRSPSRPTPACARVACVFFFYVVVGCGVVTTAPRPPLLLSHPGPVDAASPRLSLPPSRGGDRTAKDTHKGTKTIPWGPLISTLRRRYSAAAVIQLLFFKRPYRNRQIIAFASSSSSPPPLLSTFNPFVLVLSFPYQNISPSRCFACPRLLPSPFQDSRLCPTLSRRSLGGAAVDVLLREDQGHDQPVQPCDVVGVGIIVGCVRRQRRQKNGY